MTPRAMSETAVGRGSPFCGPVLARPVGSGWETAIVPQPLHELADEALMQRVAVRDHDALRVLFARYAPSAMALAYRVVRDAMLAEDVLQEAFLAVWERSADYHPDRGSVRAFVFQIVHHRAVDRVRREAVQKRRADEQAALGVPDVPGIDETVTDAAERGERRRQVRAVLNGIPSEQRRIIELMYFDGLTQQQVADRLELPLGTVKSRTLLAMRKLRAALIVESTGCDQ